MAINIETGSLIKSYLLDVKLQGDWESMALGPCSSVDTSKRCLYIGNMGNNYADSCNSTSCSQGSELVYIYKLEEPNINDYYSGTAIKVSTLIVSYSSGNFVTNRANSESLFVVRDLSDFLLICKEMKKYSYLSLIWNELDVHTNCRTTPVIKWVGSLEIFILLQSLRLVTTFSTLEKFRCMSMKA